MHMLPCSCMIGSDQTSMLGHVWGMCALAEQSGGMYEKVRENSRGGRGFIFL
jgi:hypothetical protein